MNNKIKELNEKLRDSQNNSSLVEQQLQIEWNGVFQDIGSLKDAVIRLEDSKDYYGGEYGDICSWVRFDTSPYKDCQEYFKDYMQEYHCVRVNFKDDALILSHGDDNIHIQDDTRHDNGVWQGHKVIIKESEYRDEETNEVDEVKRNQLIEAHMEKSGYFPGVYRVDRHGNIESVNTKGQE